MLENVLRRMECVLLRAPLAALIRFQALFAVRGVARAESVHPWWHWSLIFFCFVFGTLIFSGLKALDKALGPHFLA